LEIIQEAAEPQTNRIISLLFDAQSFQKFSSAGKKPDFLVAN